jgi:hypothetical protein
MKLNSFGYLGILFAIGGVLSLTTLVISKESAPLTTSRISVHLI